jgi:hypothetical protein
LERPRSCAVDESPIRGHRPKNQATCSLFAVLPPLAGRPVPARFERRVGFHHFAPWTTRGMNLPKQDEEYNHHINEI